MSDDTRSPYRFSGAEAEAVLVTAVDDQGRSTCGRGADVSASGIGVVFEGRVPEWEPNSTLRLTIEHWKLAKPVEVDGVLIHRVGRRGHVRCGFRFARPSQLGPYAELFNRRHAFRVEPAMDAPLEVSLRAENGWARESRSRKGTPVPETGAEVQGRVFDVSADGLAILVDPALKDRFSRRLRLHVTLGLPGGAARLKAHVVRVAPRRRRLLIGLRFDPAGSPEVASELARVTEYVMARQREWLQRTRNPAE